MTDTQSRRAMAKAAVVTLFCILLAALFMVSQASADQQVQVFAVTPTPTIRPPINLRVQATNDDAVSYSDGKNDYLGYVNRTMDMGRTGYIQTVGLRFANVTIRRSEIGDVDFAYFKVKTTLLSGSQPFLVLIEAERSANCNDFYYTQVPPHKRPRLGMGIWWEIWPEVGWSYSPDITNLIQLAVDQPMWRSGNHICLYITGSDILANNTFVRTLSYDNAAADAPRLHIEFQRFW